LRTSPAIALHQEQVQKLTDYKQSYDRCNERHAMIQKGYVKEINRVRQKLLAQAEGQFDSPQKQTSPINHDSPLRKMKTYKSGCGGSPSPKKFVKVSEGDNKPTDLRLKKVSTSMIREPQQIQNIKLLVTQGSRVKDSTISSAGKKVVMHYNTAHK